MRSQVTTTGMGIKRTPERKIQSKMTDFTSKIAASANGDHQPTQKSNRSSDAEVNTKLSSDSDLPQCSSNMAKNPQNSDTWVNLEKILAAIGRIENNQEETAKQQEEFTRKLFEEIIANVSGLDSKLIIIQDLYENTKKEIEVVERRVGTLEETLSIQEEVIKELRRENEFLRKKSKENNLIFYGVKDPTNESPAS